MHSKTLFITCVTSSSAHVLHLIAITNPTSASILPRDRDAQRDSSQDILSNKGIAYYFFRVNYITLHFLNYRLMFSGMWRMIYFCQTSVLFWIAICIPHNFLKLYSLEKIKISNTIICQFHPGETTKVAKADSYVIPPCWEKIHVFFYLRRKKINRMINIPLNQVI